MLQERKWDIDNRGVAAAVHPYFPMAGMPISAKEGEMQQDIVTCTSTKAMAWVQIELIIAFI